MLNDKRTKELHERSKKIIPGAQSNLRVPVGIRPTFIERGKGAHIWDVDGNEYIDYMVASGPGILGQSNPEYINALKSQLDTLLYSVSGASQTPWEIELAEKLIRIIPCAEKVRFVVTGTEAVQLAIRLCRSYTGRRYFIRFEGAFHGWLDNVLGGLVHDDPVNNPFPYEGENDPLGTDGRDPAAFEQCFCIPYNDIDVFEKVLERWGDQVAMVLVESIQAGSVISPKPGYLERVQELCRKYGIVFCIDEVVTGFRMALRGAQGVLGITPDLALYGKSLAAGMPLGAVAGKRDIMDLLLDSKVVGAGTFNGYPMGMAAALASVTILEKDNGAIYKHLDKVQTRLMEGLREILKRHGIKALVQGVGGMFIVHFIDRDVIWSERELKEVNMKMARQFRINLADEGVLILFGGRWFMCTALTEGDVDKTLECADKAVKRL